MLTDILLGLIAAELGAGIYLLYKKSLSSDEEVKLLHVLVCDKTAEVMCYQLRSILHQLEEIAKWFQQEPHGAFREITSEPENQIQLLQGSPGNWSHHSWRPVGHKDIAEVERTPGMAWRDANGIHEGVQ